MHGTSGRHCKSAEARQATSANIAYTARYAAILAVLHTPEDQHWKATLIWSDSAFRVKHGVRDRCARIQHRGEIVHRAREWQCSSIGRPAESQAALLYVPTLSTLGRAGVSSVLTKLD